MHTKRHTSLALRVVHTTASLLLLLHCTTRASEDSASTIAARAPLSTYTLKWLDKVGALDEKEVNALSEERASTDAPMKERIDRTVFAFKRLHAYETEDHAELKKEIVKLAMTALPSIDVDQVEWKRRVKELGDTWLPYLGTMHEAEAEGFQMGMARMLCYGVGVLKWRDQPKDMAIATLREYVKSGREFTILGVLMGIEEANISDLNDDIIPLVAGPSDRLRQKVGFVLAKVGNAGTAEKLKRAISDMERSNDQEALGSPGMVSVRLAVERLEANGK